VDRKELRLKPEEATHSDPSLSDSVIVFGGSEYTEGPKICIHTVLQPFSFTVLTFDKVALAFM
jgi:hypothetical protein